MREYPKLMIDSSLGFRREGRTRPGRANATRLTERSRRSEQREGQKAQQVVSERVCQRAKEREREREQTKRNETTWHEVKRSESAVETTTFVRFSGLADVFCLIISFSGSFAHFAFEKLNRTIFSTNQRVCLASDVTVRGRQQQQHSRVSATR